VLDYQKQLKKELQRYEKNAKFEPMGRAKKVFLSDAEEVPAPGQKNTKEVMPTKIELVRARE
jgi:hypothetical protein